MRLVSEPSLARLRAFLVVAEELSFTRAARRQRVAQQALSAMVRRLERELGFELFVRTTRSVSLTPAGEVLAEHARGALLALEHAVAEARKAERGDRGVLGVGVMAGAALELTEPLLEAFARARPDVKLRLHHHLYDDPTAGLRAGTTDVALLRPPLDTAGLELRPYFAEPRWAVMSRRHPLAKHRELSAAQLAAHALVRPMSPDPTWSAFWGGGDDHPTPLDVRTLEGALEHVAAGDALALVAAGWIRAYPRPGLHVVRVRELAPSVVALGWRRGQKTKLVSEFVRTALATAAAHPQLVRRIEHPRLPRR